MAEEGEEAPGFELHGVRDGAIEEIALGEYLGEDVVVLVFYPGDFNPACDGVTTGLDDLDLFTMQKDVQVLAVSGDSVFSHQAFADQYDLQIPLLTDIEGEVASRYGVGADGDRYRTHRAVFVIDHTGTIEYVWEGDSVEDAPDTDEIRTVIENIGDEETAQSRYRVGHAHYIEGRRAFTSAMNAHEDREWMLASQDFEQATEEFDEARDEFNTSVRFADDEESTRYYERAERKAEALWRAANWLSDSASAFAGGQGLKGEELQSDAEGPLETARDLHEPIDPEDFPPDTDPTEDGEGVGLSTDDGMELDIGETPETADSTTATEARTEDETSETDAEGGATGETASADASESEDEEQADDIDDAELEAITAELEEQNEAANDDGDGTTTPQDASEAGDTDGSFDHAEDDPEDEDLELDLIDPTEEADDTDEEAADDTDEETADDIDSGDHGVPDSL